MESGAHLANKLLTGRLIADDLNPAQLDQLTEHLLEQVITHGAAFLEQQMVFSQSSRRLQLLRAFVLGYISRLSGSGTEKKSALPDDLYLRLVHSLYESELVLFGNMIRLANDEDKHADLRAFCQESYEWMLTELETLNTYKKLIASSDKHDNLPYSSLPEQASAWLIGDYNHRRTILTLRKQILATESEPDQMILLLELRREIISHQKSIAAFMKAEKHEAN